MVARNIALMALLLHASLMNSTACIVTAISRLAIKIQSHKFQRIWVYRWPNQWRTRFRRTKRNEGNTPIYCPSAYAFVLTLAFGKCKLWTFFKQNCTVGQNWSTTWLTPTEYRTEWVIAIYPKGRIWCVFSWHFTFHENVRVGAD